MPTGTHYAIRNAIFFSGQADVSNIRLVGVAPEITWEETDQTDPSGRYKTVVNNDTWRIQRATAAEFGSIRDIFTVDGSGPYIGLGQGPQIGTAVTIRPDTTGLGSTTVVTGLAIDNPAATIHPTTDNVYVVNIQRTTFSAADAETLALAISLKINGDPIAGTNITITEGHAFWVDAGSSRFDGDILVDGAFAIKANTATEIALQVDNTALTIGSEGSLKIPIKTTTGAPNDAQFGNADSCFGYNSFDNTLEIRDGGAFLSVGVAGYVIQRRVPALWATGESWQHPTFPNISVQKGDGWYHPNQYLEEAEEDSTGQINIFVDEGVCSFCGKELKPGEMIVLAANGRTRGEDLHCVFAHNHIEHIPEFKNLRREVEELTAKISRLESLQAA